jgi:hypothetical protein
MIISVVARASSVTFVHNIRAAFLPWALFSIICLSCGNTVPQMPELPPHYAVYPPEQLSFVPIILVGRVRQHCRPVGKPHPSRWDGYPKQQWQVEVSVEHVLQGETQPADLSIYYFAYVGNLESSDYPLTDLATGDYVIFFLQRDNGNLRTICDGWHNCAVKVLTGAHPNYKRVQSPTINDAILDVLLTKGQNGTDEQIISTLRRLRDYGNSARIRALERLSRDGSSTVAAYACLTLSHTPGAKACATAPALNQ